MDDDVEYEIVLTADVWASTLRRLSVSPDELAVGGLRRQYQPLRTELIVDDLDVRASPPTGKEFAPLADWLVVAMPGQDSRIDLGGWIERLEPKFSQLLVILLLGFNEDRSGWQGWCIHRGARYRLAGFRVVGPEMLTVNVDEQPTELVTVDPQRWSRTVDAVGKPAFNRLHNASVAIVGCSRTGSLLAGMLAALGVRRLVLIDGDAVEPHNLDGMLLATESDLGRNKALAIARRLQTFRSDMAITAVPHAYGTRIEEPALRNADLIATCVDQNVPRLRAAQFSIRRVVPHLDIGTGVTRIETGRQIAADVRLLLPGRGCIRCVGGLPDLPLVEEELRAPIGALPRRQPPTWDAQGRVGSLVTLNSMACSTAIQSWLDLLNGDLKGSIWHRMRWGSGESWETDAAYVSAKISCPLCQTASHTETS